MPRGTKGPKVFISYATPDVEQARRLAVDLSSRGIRTYFAPHDIRLGENVPLRISHELGQSDYFVLLVSSSIDRPWVELEWSAALARELRERRVFLFLLRLDDTPPPTLLLTRNYLDGFSDWSGAVNGLVESWHEDWTTRRAGIEVLPAPGAPDDCGESTVGIHVLNRALGVQHFLRIPLDADGEQIYRRVQLALDLRDRVDAIGGRIGLCFSYELLRDGARLEDGSAKPAKALADGEVFELIVKVESFGPRGAAEPVTFRAPDASGEPGAGDPDRSVERKLLLRAFSHLLPRRGTPEYRR